MNIHVPARRLIVPVLFAVLLALPVVLFARDGHEGRGGYVSLEGLQEFRGLVDLSHGEPRTVLRYLELVAQMDDDLKDLGLDRRIVVAMRGGSVRYLLRDTSRFELADQADAEAIHRAVAMLRARDVRIEACKVAMDRFHIPAEGVLSEVRVVNNTFITLIGFQQQGYGMVAIP